MSSPRWLLYTALALTGLAMRTSVTSVGAVLDDLQAGLHMSSGVAGVVTTLPVICFASLGVLTPRVARRVGAHRLLVLALAIAAVGTVARALVSDVAAFALLSVLALTGGAVSNVLLPSLVKVHFPDRIGAATAVYTTALAVGTTAGAGLTVPIGDGLGGGWRTGLASWALFSAVAVLPWLGTLVAERTRVVDGSSALSLGRLVHSRTAWALMLFFATQSLQAYIAFGWFERFLNGHGISHGTAGAMVALLSAVGIPVSLFAPRAGPHWHRPLIGLLALCYLVAYVGLLVAPRGGAWVWMVFVGFGSGMFPISLTLIGMRARTPGTTAALSAFVQSLGYVIAGCGPLLFGALYGLTGTWGVPMVVLFVALGLTVLSAWPATAARYVDDELAPSARDDQRRAA